MKFSVITPTFNAGEKIKQNIGSVINQISGDTKVEHIIQDGSSTDNTVAILEQIYNNSSLNNYDLLYISQPDKGMYDALNKGWAKASGDIFSWLNHDEQYLPCTLQKVKKIFEENQDVDVVWGNMIIVDPDGYAIAARREIPLRKFYILNDFLYAISCTIFFRKRLFDEQLLYFDTTYRNAGDLDLVLRLLNNKIKFYHINDYLSLFGVDGNNLTVSLGDNMAKEVSIIQKKYGALPVNFLRKTVKLIRFVERTFRGCYKKEDLIYDFVVDEEGNSKKFSLKNIGFRFSYDRVERLIQKNDKK